MFLNIQERNPNTTGMQKNFQKINEAWICHLTAIWRDVLECFNKKSEKYRSLIRDIYEKCCFDTLKFVKSLRKNASKN